MFSSDMKEYRRKYALPVDAFTMRDVERIYQLDPAPPKPEHINDYIAEAIHEQSYLPFLFFLHHYERKLNTRVRRFLMGEGLDSYDPVRFLEYKQCAVTVMLACLDRYDPAKDAAFLTFAHHYIGNAFLNRRRVDSTGSFKNLMEYKTIRRIAWLYNDPAKTEQEAISDFSKKYNLTEETAAEHLTVAKRNQPGLPIYKIVQDEEAEETGEDVTCDDSWDYAAILWGDIRADEIRTVFEKLGYREQTLLEGRCAICMTCGRVSSMSKRKSFEDLAVMFEGSDSSGAERAYRRALDKLIRLLVEQGTLDAVELKRKSIRRKNKKIAEAIYAYSANCDGDWGELSFDFVNETAEILKLADDDTIKTNRYAKAAIREILSWTGDDLPKSWLVAMEREDVFPSQEERIRRLVEQGKCHAVTIKANKENSYYYLADLDGEWGELLIDRVTNTGEIVKLAELDTTKSNRFANRAIRFLLQLEGAELHEEMTLTFEG